MTGMRLEHRPGIAYCALPVDVTMATLAAVVPDAMDDLERYMASRGIQPTGPSLIRYRTVSEHHPFTIEVGWAVEHGPWIDAPFIADTLPAGRYAAASHVGPYSELHAVTSALLEWGTDEGAIFDVIRADNGDHWLSWYELYADDPVEGPDGPEGAVEVCLRVLD